jgi:hypothetical protein
MVKFGWGRAGLRNLLVGIMGLFVAVLFIVFFVCFLFILGSSAIILELALLISYEWKRN